MHHVRPEVMANSVLRTKCGQWVHDICTKMKRVTSTLAKGFICERCVEIIKGTFTPAVYDLGKIVKCFCFLGKRLNASGGSDAAVTARKKNGKQNLENVGNFLMEESFR